MAPIQQMNPRVFTRPLRLGVIVAAIIVLGFLATMLFRSPPPRAGHVGTIAPDITLTTLDGAPLRLEELRGRTVLLNFWATWCIPCRAELPALAATAETYADAGLSVIAVNFGEDRDTAQQFLDRLGVDLSATVDPQGEAADAFAVVNLPTSVLIDGDGRIIARHVGYLNETALDAFVGEGLKLTRAEE